mmetsp:Transcript_144423/g.359992  ORF Transcript_144423/g.359992 Transcript_144423/m.359992 type:complete len:217 (-) Transcript_144423:165-815(-)
MRRTTKGDSTMRRMFFSLITEYSMRSCCRYPFDTAFSAYVCPVFLSASSVTTPKAPTPSLPMRCKSRRCTRSRWAPGPCGCPMACAAAAAAAPPAPGRACDCCCGGCCCCCGCFGPPRCAAMNLDVPGGDTSPLAAVGGDQLSELGAAGILCIEGASPAGARAAAAAAAPGTMRVEDGGLLPWAAATFCMAPRCMTGSRIAARFCACCGDVGGGVS